MASGATHSPAPPTDAARESAPAPTPAPSDLPISATNALELLVGVTHDLRSPLTSILLLVERLRTGGAGPVTPQQERQLGLVYSAAFGMASLADDVMELATGGTRLIGAAPVPFAISAVLRAVRELVQPIAEEKGLVLRCSAPPQDVRLGHPAALHRVLLNLVTNALKFTHNGSVSVYADLLDGDAVRFRVDDTGRGLPDAVHAQLAMQSGLAESPMSVGDSGRPFSSSGLGVAFCQRLLAGMDSRLCASAREPVGTRMEFTVALPLSFP
jgi:signal transduction histidine kinase